MSIRSTLAMVTALLLTCPTVIPRAEIDGVARWAYQLQNIDPVEIAGNASFELVVVDYSSDGGPAGEWLPEDIEQIRQGGKIPVAYISIGEAEDYRFYWDPAWEINPPDWLGPENPDWPGNYKVRFWDPQWQAIVFEYMARIHDQGFGGLYLDIVDGYYYWSEIVQERPQADADMANFVLAIADSLRGWGGPAQLVIPQNGSFLPVEDDVEGPLAEAYFAAIDAIGVEDVFFYGPADEDNPYNPDSERLAMLAEYRSRGKKVFSIEYLTLAPLIEQYRQAARDADFIPYVSVRALDQLADGMYTGVADWPLGGDGPRFFPARPNPTRAALRIPVHVQEGPVDLLLEVFEVSGRRLSLRPYRLDQGWRELVWEGRPELPSGLYLYRVRRGNKTLAEGKFLKIR